MRFDYKFLYHTIHGKTWSITTASITRWMFHNCSLRRLNRWYPTTATNEHKIKRQDVTLLIFTASKAYAMESSKSNEKPWDFGGQNRHRRKLFRSQVRLLLFARNLPVGRIHLSFLCSQRIKSSNIYGKLSVREQTYWNCLWEIFAHKWHWHRRWAWFSLHCLRLCFGLLRTKDISSRV